MPAYVSEAAVEKVKKEEFSRIFLEKLASRIPDGMRLDKKEVIKTNDIRLTGVVVAKDEPGTGAYPTFYTESLYNDYRGIPVEDAAEMAASSFMDNLEKYEEDHAEVKKCVVENGFRDYDAIRDRLRIQLVSTEWNREFLADKPSRTVGDFSEVFRVTLGDARNSFSSSFVITDDILDSYGVSKEQLFEDAVASEDREGHVLCNMYECLEGYMEYADMDKAQNLFADTEAAEYQVNPFPTRMYIMSNADKMYGASTMVRDDLLSKAADIIGGDFYILPSSVHETILIPSEDVMDPADLCRMIREINVNEVAADEVLSDDAFLFDSKAHILINTASGFQFKPELTEKEDRIRVWEGTKGRELTENKVQALNKMPKKKRRSR